MLCIHSMIIYFLLVYALYHALASQCVFQIMFIWGLCSSKFHTQHMNQPYSYGAADWI